MLFPAGLALALLRHRLFHLRPPLQRTAITALLVSAAMAVGLALAARGAAVAGVGAAVLLAGIGLPLAQRGEGLDAAIDPAGLVPVLERLRGGLGLDGLCLRRDGTVLARSGTLDPGTAQAMEVRHEGRLLAILEVGEKRHDEELLEADHEALNIVYQQLAAYLTRQELLLDLHATVEQLEEMQRRLLSARRRERERLMQQLHRGPLQDIILLERTFAASDAQAAEAAAGIARSLRNILTETGATMLSTLGLPRALRAYIEYLTPAAQAQGCLLDVELDDGVAALAEDEAFALYQLAHEALANVVRHGGARHATVRLWQADERVCLEVRDDGRGLPESWDEARLDHRGLRDALDVVLSVGGATAGAGRVPGGGTLVWAAVPWRRPEDGEEREKMPGDGPATLIVVEQPPITRHRDWEWRSCRCRSRGVVLSCGLCESTFLRALGAMAKRLNIPEPSSIPGHRVPLVRHAMSN